VAEPAVRYAVVKDDPEKKMLFVYFSSCEGMKKRLKKRGVGTGFG
jgi:hypothetical protein